MSTTWHTSVVCVNAMSSISHFAFAEYLRCSGLAITIDKVRLKRENVDPLFFKINLLAIHNCPMI